MLATICAEGGVKYTYLGLPIYPYTPYICLIKHAHNVRRTCVQLQGTDDVLLSVTLYHSDHSCTTINYLCSNCSECMHIYI